MNLHIGPIRPTVVQGLRHWHYLLADNDYGIRFDLHWYDEHRSVYHASETPALAARPRGRRPDVTADFEGFGSVEGWVEIDSRRFEFTRDTCRGTRDRHWGVGRGVGGPAFHLGRSLRPGWIGGNWVAFRDFAIWGNLVLYRYGNERPGMGRVVETRRRVRFEEGTHLFLEARIDYTLDSGEVKELHFERLGVQTAFMRCGLYGGTPEGEIYQGQYVGDNVVEGDRYDVRNPAVRRRLTGLNEHHCRVRCGDEVTTGILQPVEPDAYEACLAGKPGWSFLD